MNTTPDIQEIEKRLAQLPKFERSQKADQAFYAKLYELAGKSSNEDIETKNWFSWILSPRFAFAGITAVLLVMVSSVFAAYQPGVTYGHALYGLKRTAEKVELAFAFSPLSKIDAHLNFSDRRLEEANNIMGKSSSLAFLLQTAFADEGEVGLTDEQEQNLEKTLEDMKSEVDKAAEIIETRVTEPSRARAALERIEQTTNQHIDTLNRLEKRGQQRIKEIVRRVSGNEDLRMAIVIEAREEVADALEKRKENVQLILKMRHEEINNVKKSIEERRQEVQKEVQKAIEHLETLPVLDQDKFELKINTVKDAFEKGKFGQAEGLSRAIQKRMLEFQPAPPIQLKKPEQKEELQPKPEKPKPQLDKPLLLKPADELPFQPDFSKPEFQPEFSPKPQPDSIEKDMLELMRSIKDFKSERQLPPSVPAPPILPQI